MDWVVDTSSSILQTGLWLLGLGAAFGVLGRWMPCNRGMSWWRDLGAAATDLLYWLVTPIVMRLGRTLLLAAGLGLFGVGSVIGEDWAMWQECLAVFVIQDVLLYWIHRLFHTRHWWKFHAVHHSSTELDWMSAARFHVVNHLLAFTLVDVVVLLLGFSPMALLVLAPLNTIYSSMVHANLNWTFGPLRHLLASPVFHRWHHTAEGEGLDKNFAPTLPILDVLFGTFYMPPGRVPEHFGIGETDFPADFWGQFLRPFQGLFSPPLPPVLRGERAGVRGDSVPRDDIVFARDDGQGSCKTHSFREGHIPPSPLSPRSTGGRGKVANVLTGFILATIVVAGLMLGDDVRQRNYHYACGEDFYARAEYTRAIAAYTQALEHDANCALAYANRASAYFNVGEVTRSLADFDRALACDSGLSLAYWRRGIVHQVLGNDDLARRDRQRARELDPGLREMTD